MREGNDRCSAPFRGLSFGEPGVLNPGRRGQDVTCRPPCYPRGLTMPRSKLLSLDAAAALIPDGATVSVSSSSGLGCPDATLRAIGQRFAATGEPRGLTTIHPIAAGDMYG